MFYIETIILIPIFAVGFLLMIPMTENQKKLFALWSSLLPLPISLMLWVGLDQTNTQLQYISTYAILPSMNVFLTLGLDGLSAPLVSLTCLLCPLCILVGWQTIRSFLVEYLIAWLILESLLIAVFTTFDLILFYILFEATLLPMFIMVGIWGSRSRKVKAAYQLFLYTLFGSMFMLLALLLIYAQVGSFDYGVLLSHEFTPQRQLVMFLAFLVSFGVKIPMVPLHLWLPEAHVEAPTGGSVILAGILLKLGGYGFIRYTLPLFPEATLFYTPLVHTLSLIGIIYASLTTLRQVDMKKAIAYSSVAHMGVVTLGIFSGNLIGVVGACVLMLAHGVVSPGLFLCVGFLYDRHKTRLIRYYGGLAQTMPIFSGIFLFFSMANLALPGTANFVGEFLCILGCFQNNNTAALLACSGMISGAAYSLWLFTRVAFGTLKAVSFTETSDLTRREFAIFVPLICLTLWMGFYPNPIITILFFPVACILEVGI